MPARAAATGEGWFVVPARGLDPHPVVVVPSARRGAFLSALASGSVPDWLSVRDPAERRHHQVVRALGGEHAVRFVAGEIDGDGERGQDRLDGGLAHQRQLVGGDLDRDARRREGTAQARPRPRRRPDEHRHPAPGRTALEPHRFPVEWVDHALDDDVGWIAELPDPALEIVGQSFAVAGPVDPAVEVRDRLESVQRRASGGC